MIGKQNTPTNLEAWEKQIIYYRDHLDVFIEDAFPPIRLTRDQHVIARQFGRCSDIKIVQSRGSGKTWLTAVCCHALCCLYPGTSVVVCSGTAGQASLVLEKLKKLADENPNVANELMAGSARSLVQLSKTGGKTVYKNSSMIVSAALSSMRGRRAKIIVVDECPEVSQEDQEAIVSPIKNETRANAFNYGFKDYLSKTVNITSACEKANSFYNEFVRVVKGMSAGDKQMFACALDYKAAAANGITAMEYFEGERRRMPDLIFQMEYGSKFMGATNNSAFPHELTQSCRTLQKVETSQPRNSKSRYVISLDIATSEAKDADNSIITVMKFTERVDGTFAKKLVYIRSFHGKTLDILADEIRKLYHLSFPNTEKIVYDARGLGDSLDRFFDNEWVDVLTGKEYPPLITDDTVGMTGASLKILHPFRAVQTLNQRLYTNLRVALEKRTIELPVSERLMRAKQEEITDKDKKITTEEMNVYREADALQYEMGNIIAKVGASGNVLYDTPRATMHKDRYSSLAMANDYICELEKENLKRHSRSAVVVGLVSAW